MVAIRQNICPEWNWKNKCPYAMTPTRIVVHNTANDASANNEVVYMNRNTNQISYHFAVDNVEAVQGLPLDRNGWHAGDGGSGTGNRKGIGIEICYSLSGGARFDQAERNAAWLVAKLLKERGWGMGQVTKHQDYAKKYCPHRTLDYGWQRFLNMVQAELNEMNKPAWQWVAMEDPRELVAKGNINIYEIPSLKVVGTIGDGKITPFVQKSVISGKTYLRSQWSKDYNKNHGVLFDTLAEKPAPAPTPKVVWLDVKKTDGQINGTTNLIDLDTDKVVKEVSGLFEYVQISDDGVWIRTIWSKDNNKNYAIKLESLVHEEPEKPKPETEIKWIRLPETIKLVCCKEAYLINLLSEAVIKTFPEGTVIEDIIEYTEYKGKKWYRTTYSADKDLSNAFYAQDLIEVEEENPPKPEPTPEPIPAPIEPDKNPLIKFISWIITSIANLIKKIFNKGDK